VNTFLLRMFQHEVKLQCQFILLAVEQLKEVEGRELAHHSHYERERERARHVRDESDREEFEATLEYSKRLHPLRHGYPSDTIEQSWMALQTIAVSAANLSKLFWGSRGKKEETRRALRESLGIEDGCCLQSTSLRNSFEHFDERIEERFEGTKVRGFIGRNIGPMEILTNEAGEPIEPEWRFGQYDPNTGQLAFWTKSVNIFDITAEARRILRVAETETMKPSWVDEGEGSDVRGP
jgi:hypothetical protein